MNEPTNTIPEVEMIPKQPVQDLISALPKDVTAFDAFDAYRAAVDRGDILASARDSSNRLQTQSQITEKSLVRVGGFEMRVVEAERLGYLRKGEAGYEVAQTTPQPQAPNPAKEQAALEAAGVYAPEPLPRAAAEEFAKLSHGISPELQSQVAREWLRGEYSEETIKAFAGAMGEDGDPDKALKAIHRVTEIYAEQAHAAISKRGVNSQSLIAWAEEHAAPELKAAMKIQATQKSVKGYDRVVNQYLRSLDTINPTGVLKLNAGPNVKIQQSPGGPIVVSSNGKSFSWKQAVDLGLVKFK